MGPAEGRAARSPRRAPAGRPLPLGPTWLRPPGPRLGPPARPLPPPPALSRPMPEPPPRRRTLLKAKSSCLSFSRCGSAPCRRNRNFIILRPAAGAAPAAAAARRMRRAAPPVLRRGRGARRPGRGRARRGLHGGGRRQRLTCRPTNGCARALSAPPLPARQWGKIGPPGSAGLAKLLPPSMRRGAGPAGICSP